MVFKTKIFTIIFYIFRVETDPGISHTNFSRNTVRDHFKNTEKLIELLMSHREDEFTSAKPFRFSIYNMSLVIMNYTNLVF